MVFDTVCAVQDFIVPQTLRTPGTLTFSLWGLLELGMVSLGRRGLLDFLGKMVFQPYNFNRFNAGDLNVPQCKKNRTNLTLSKSDLNVPHVLHVGKIAVLSHIL